MARRQQAEYLVDNAQLQHELTKWCAACRRIFSRDPSAKPNGRRAKVSDTLALLVSRVILGASTHRDFSSYPEQVLEDMRSSAFHDFMRWGHNFNVEKSQAESKAFVFIRCNAINSFRKHLSRFHYKHKNLVDSLTDSEFQTGGAYRRNYSVNLCSDLHDGASPEVLEMMAEEAQRGSYHGALSINDDDN